jgi:signal recognition particle receptor subunit beta
MPADAVGKPGLERVRDTRADPVEVDLFPVPGQSPFYRMLSIVFLFQVL